MASFKLTNSATFAEGVTVKAFPKSNWSNPGQPSGPPLGSSTAEATMSSGSANLTGLTAGTEYWAVAQVGSAYRYVGILAGADVAAVNASSLLAASGKGFKEHGEDEDAVRPEGFASVEWLGSVEPENAIDGDSWIEV